MTILNGGVCAAKGFKASGIYCQIKKEESKKRDLALVVSEKECDTACVYTTNKVEGAPVTVTKENMKKSGFKSRAIIVNSKIANTCNADGVEKAAQECEIVARELGIKPEEVIVASTGVIGEPLPIKPIIKGINPLVQTLSKEGHTDAAEAIMTTDTRKKEYAVEFKIGDITCTIGGMAKGSGMICPNMATTLNFITTDAAIGHEALQKALSENTKITYNCLSIDGDTSTNDMVSLMANGMAENEEIKTGTPEFETFKSALYDVMASLTKMLARDGEGASKLIECDVKGAKDLDTALIVAKSVVKSNLLKAAIFGEDPNWGRILCAIGYADAEFDINRVDVAIKSKLGEIKVCENGSGIPFDDDLSAMVLSDDEIIIAVDLKDGNESGKAWGCDLTYDYVKINGDYRT